MTNHALYVLVVPYLPLKKKHTFADWTIAPLASVASPWSNEKLEGPAKAFIDKFRDGEGKALKNPAVLYRTQAGVDGTFPGEPELAAAQLALWFGLLDANPNWEPEVDGWWISTTDNADIWAQPIQLTDGRVALSRGSLVTHTSGPWKLSDPALEIRAPLELTIPLDSRFVADSAEAIYRVAIGADDGANKVLAHRLSTAVRWLGKAWRNTPGLGPEDRIVMLRTAFEALTGTSDAADAIETLEAAYQPLRELGITAEATEHLLWSSADHPHRALTFTTKGGKAKTVTLTDLGHWYSSLGQARHMVVHEGIVPDQSYEEPDSPYNGPYFFRGERLLRETIRVLLRRFGYDDLWEDAGNRALSRAIASALAKAQQEQAGQVD